MRIVFALAVAVLPVACTQFPELDEAATPGVAQAPYPQLVPLESLLAAPAPVRATEETVDTVEGRVDSLRSRADRLKSVEVAQGAAVPDRLARLRRQAEALRAQ
jgi:hypothetical protein